MEGICGTIARRSQVKSRFAVGCGSPAGGATRISKSSAAIGTGALGAGTRSVREKRREGEDPRARHDGEATAYSLLVPLKGQVLEPSAGVAGVENTTPVAPSSPDA